MTIDEVILVNEKDEVLGSMEKMEAHEKGKLHRAFSVFIFNTKNELLLQQRTQNKYHSPGLWTNTCCSHPRPGETNETAASRRLKEEMGLTCNLKHKGEFIYRVEFKNGLIEHEFDHIFIGMSEENPKINPEEVQDYKWITIKAIRNEIKNHPAKFTHWFKIAIEAQFTELE